MAPRSPESGNQQVVWGALYQFQNGQYPSQSGKNWMFFCPCHDDGKKEGRRSLSVLFNDDGSTAVHCFACKGSPSQFYSLLAGTLGIPRDSFNGSGSLGSVRLKGHDSNPGKKKGTIVVSTHIYVDASGQPIYKVERRMQADGTGSKFYWQYAYVHGEWEYFGGKKPRPEGAILPTLYNLPKVLASVQAGTSIYVVEGEKAADRLIEAGLVATTNAGGANKWTAEYADFLTGANVVILPDHDDPGEKHAALVLKSVQGKANSVKVLRLPGLQQKEDVYDWLTTRGHTAEELSSLADQTPEAPQEETAPAKASKWSQLLTTDDLLGRPAKQWLLDQFLGVGDFAMVAGPPGAGKSFIILDLCLALVLGEQFASQFNAREDATRVLYLASEGHEGFSQRLKAAKKKYQVEAQHLQNFRIIEAVPNFYAQGGEDAVESFIEGLQSTGFHPDLIVVDTFHDSITGANENDSGDAGVVLKNIQKVRQALACAVMVVHHTGKSGETERGSSAYKGKADLLVFVQSDGPSGELKLGKSKDGGHFNPIPFSLAKEHPDDPTESPSVAWSGESAFRPSLTKREQAILDFVTTQATSVSAADVADALGIDDKGNVGTILNRLSGRGLVIRGLQDPSRPKSSRNQFVFTTPKLPEVLKDENTGKTKIKLSLPA